ncbi:competence protein ComEC [Flagellimonas zhangzhouensis]|uniref:Competence protein ComEC n=2 Tax=Flagellimonas zhangzhouensis TaxID=1073328 RepID=A0A1H2VPX2_9FLAO|nr:competence protein ComEC [Allomuricauda zhangzhouensis]SDW70351.1 competence protein ComEC [Allomuricauda zhangzhouensis]
MLGIVIGFYVEITPLLSLIFMVVLLPILYGVGKKQPREGFPYFEISTALLVTCLGIFSVGLATYKSYQNHDISKEHTWKLKVREVLKPNDFSQRYFVDVLAVENEKAAGRLLLSLSKDSSSVGFGVDDEFYVTGKVETIRSPLNPNQFDYKAYLQKQGISHQIRADEKAILLVEDASKTLVGRASNFREHIISKLKAYDFGTEELGVIEALLLGKRDDISETTYNNYINAGAVHILAVSGLHVGILLLILQFLCSPLEQLPKGKTLKMILVIALLWSYAFVAGLSPSIVRAVTMFSFLAYAIHLNRPTNSFNIIALSMLFILLMKPLFLFQVGFQMSYAAVIAIVWIYPKLQRFWFPDNIFVRKVWQLLSVSAAAQLGVLPISLFYFHQFPALFFVSNLLVIPFLGLILGLGILVIALALFDLLPSFLVTLFNEIIEIMNSIIGWVANQEGFLIKNIPFDSVQLLMGYFIVFALVIFLSKTSKRKLLVLFGGLVVFQNWLIWSTYQTNNTEKLSLAHRSRNTVLLHQTGSELFVYAKDSSNLGSLAYDFSVAERIQNIAIKPIQNSYKIGTKKLYVIDSLGLFPLEKEYDYLLLTQSPKVNLERLLDSIQPKTVLADGSNYPSYVKRWKQTCSEKEIPFHHTGEKGFYVFDSADD